MLFNNVIKFLLSENTPSIYNLLSYNITIYFSRFIVFFESYFFNNIHYLINFIMNILNIFAMFIFIEIIIFHFCGLDYNSRKSIKKREEEEKRKNLIEKENSTLILYKDDNEQTKQ